MRCPATPQSGFRPRNPSKWCGFVHEVETDATGALTEYRYDAAGQLSVVVNPLGSVLSSGRDARGLETSATHVDYASGANLLARDLTGNEAASTAWSAGAGTTTAVASAPNGTAVGTVAWAGAQSVALTATTSGAIQASVPSNLRASVTAGQTFSAVGYVRAATVGRSGTWVGIQWYNSSGTLLSTSQGTSITDTTTGWTKLVATDAAPSGAVTAGVILNVSATSSGEIHRFDGVRLLPGTPRDITSYASYDNAGRLATKTDALRRVTGYAYYDDDLLASVSALDYHEPAGITPAVRDITLWRASYDGLGNVLFEWRGSDLRFNRYSYDHAGRQVWTRSGFSGTEENDYADADYRDTSIGYDRDGHVTETSLTSSASAITETRRATYDALGRPLTSTVVNTGGDLVTRYGNDQRGLPITVTGPRGSSLGDLAYTTSTTFDAYGRPSQITLPQMSIEATGGTASNTRPVIDYGYNTFGDQTQLRDARGNLTTSTFDAAGRLTRVDLPTYTRPDTAVLSPYSTTAYNAAGLPTTTTDPRNQTSSYAYDTAGRLMTQTDPQVSGQAAPGRWRSSYDDVGNLTSRIDPTDATTTTVYDDLNRVRFSTVVETKGTPVSSTTEYRYNDASDLIKTIGPSGETTSIGINRFGEAVSITDPLTQTTAIQRDAAGRITKITDPLGRATKSIYDLAGRLTSTKDLAVGGAELRTTSYGYDANSNQTSITSPLGWVTTSTYDAANRLISQVEPVSPNAADSITTTFGYDANGNRTRVTDGNNHPTYTSYNPWNLPVNVVEPPTTAHPNAADRTWTATYDSGGLPVRLDAPGGVARVRTFDELQRLTAETGSGAEATTASRGLGYDLAGRLTSESTPTGNETFTWNDRSQTLSASGPAGSASFAYDASGRMTSRSDAAGTAAFTWSARSELKTATDPLTGATRTYTYNNGGDLTDIDFGTGKAHQTIAWNDLRQPTSDTLKTSGGATIASTAWTWDTEGNILTRTQGPAGIAGAGTTSYSYDRANRLNAATATNGQNTLYEWDKAGNRTRAGVGRATYDDRNRQTSQTTGTDVTPLFSDDWTGTSGTGWNATKWATTTNDNDKKALIQQNQGQLFVHNASVRATAQMTATADMEARFTYRFDDRSASSFLRVFLRASGASGASQMPNAYRFEVASNSPTIKLQKFVNSNVTEIGSFTHTQDTNPQRVRFRVQGTTIQAKIWPVGSPEPTDWSMTATDSAVTAAGVAQFTQSHTSGDRSVYIDELNIVNPTAADTAAAALTTTTSNWTQRGTLASRVTGAVTEAMTFDAFDRLISDATTTYSYDSLDRLTKRNTSSFAYAGLEKEPVSDANQLFARDPNGNPLALRSGATNVAVRRDLIHGDLTGTFTPNGTSLTDSRAYEPFGAVIASTGTTNPALGFQSQWADPTNGKVNMQARWYDPAAGGFTSRDDWNNPPAPSAGMNRYGYGNGDPVGSTDLTGHNAATLQAGIDLGGLLGPAIGAGLAAGAGPGAAILAGGAGYGAGYGLHQMMPTLTPQSFQFGVPTIPYASVAKPALKSSTLPGAALDGWGTQTGGLDGWGSASVDGWGSSTTAASPAITAGSDKGTDSGRKRCTINCISHDVKRIDVKRIDVKPPTLEPVQVPESNLKSDGPPKFSEWKNTLDADPLAGVTQANAINEAPSGNSSGPQPGSAPEGPNPGPILEALRERAREWLHNQDDPCAKDLMRGGKVVWSENNCGTTGPTRVHDPARGNPQATQSVNLPFRDAGLRSQVDAVVNSFDEFGRPPTGVAQGGLKGHPKGTYGGQGLPDRPLGYYTESDVWVSGGGTKRGADRLVFGRDGEVYYTPTHYDDFLRIR